MPGTTNAGAGFAPAPASQFFFFLRLDTLRNNFFLREFRAQKRSLAAPRPKNMLDIIGVLINAHTGATLEKLYHTIYI